MIFLSFGFMNVDDGYRKKMKMRKKRKKAI